MSDMYEYSNSRSDLPQVKYTSTSRDLSPALSDRMKTSIELQVSLGSDSLGQAITELDPSSYNAYWDMRGYS